MKLISLFLLSEWNQLFWAIPQPPVHKTVMFQASFIKNNNSLYAMSITFAGQIAVDILSS